MYRKIIFQRHILELIYIKRSRYPRSSGLVGKAGEAFLLSEQSQHFEDAR